MNKENMKRMSLRMPAPMIDRLNGAEVDRFQPFCENGSAVARIIFEFWFRIVDGGMLPQFVRALQICPTLSDVVGRQAPDARESTPEASKTAGSRSVEALRSRRPLLRLSRLGSYRRAHGAGSVVPAYCTFLPVSTAFRRSFA